MENICRTAGFNEKQITTLIKGKPLEYTGELYSEEHDCKFTVERVTAQVMPDPADKRKLQLNIDKVPFKVWCKRQGEKLRHILRPQTKSRYKL